MNVTWIHFFCVFLANLKITGDEEELQRLTAKQEQSDETAFKSRA